MARRRTDVFGFDELEKAFTKCEQKYPDQADAFLMALGRAVNKRVKQLTPIKTKKLRKSWRLKKVKLYKNGTVRVVREESKAPHAHLIEDGHRIVTRKRTRDSRGRFGTESNRLGKTSNLSRFQKKRFGVRSGNFVEGRHMLENAMAESRMKFNSGAEKLLARITKDVEV